jgi:DNA uptake protein ComE-like DNA-binding protein
MRQRGFVLASTLSMLLLLSTIALAVAFIGRLELEAAARRREARQAYLAARSGLTFVERKLRGLDPSYFSLDLLEGENTWDSSQLPSLPFAFTVKLTDEAGKLDLNLATSQMLEALGFTQDQAERIVAFRQERPLVTVTELGQALSLEPDSWGRVEELVEYLTVTGRTPDVNPIGEGKLVLGEFTAQELVKKGQGAIPQSLAERVAPREGGIAALRDLARIVTGKQELILLVDWLAERNDPGGKININTAAQKVLEAIPGFGAGLVQKIIQRRQESPFKSLAELVELEEFSLSTWQECAGWVAVGSNSFCLEAEGSYREGRSTIVAVWSQGRYLYWQED